MLSRVKLKRPSAPVVDLFQQLLTGTGGEPRVMFGQPAGFVNGNLFMGLFGDSLFVRLAEGDRAELLGVEGTALFDPMGGRPMREYVVVPAGWLEGDADSELRAWARKAIDYGAALPPKTKGARPSSAARKATATAPTGKRPTTSRPSAKAKPKVKAGAKGRRRRAGS
jgi:hypothetical protein